MALCCLLAFWTGGDQSRMDRLFRQSGLHREKWDEVHYADGSTYGEKTVERAVATSSDFYDPDDAAGAAHDESRRSTGADSDSATSVGHETAYLVEKNQLLRERIEDLEASLAQKSNRIEELESMGRALRESSTDQPSTADSTPVNGSESREQSESDSVWMRTKRFIRRTGE